MPVLSEDSLRTLWERMAEVYGHRWTSSFGEDAGSGAGATWARGLGGLTRRHLAAGMSACIASADPWPPTLPEFRARCLGIPPVASVRLDVERVNPFSQLVWQHLDGYRYRQAPADQADRMLREAYELAREHVMRGGTLPAVRGRLEHSTAPAAVVPGTREAREARTQRARDEAGIGAGLPQESAQ